jgi:hypothetical protein
MLCAVVAFALWATRASSDDPLYRSELERVAAEIRGSTALSVLQQTLSNGDAPTLGAVVRDLQLVPRGGQEIADLRKAVDDFLGRDLAILADPGAEPGIRRLIARDVGVRLPHPVLLPLLRLIAHSNEQDRIRAAAAYGMSLIPSASVIPELIGLSPRPQ